MKRMLRILGATFGQATTSSRASRPASASDTTHTHPASPETRAPRSRGVKRWVALGTLLGFLTASGIGLLAFLYSGVYDIAATHPHAGLPRLAILTLKRNSVEYHARNLRVPDLSQPQLVRRGFLLYRQDCLACHGAPGVARSPIGRGMNPNPPPLESAARNWTSAEIAWIIANGLKMAGMPGFGLGAEQDDLWALTAFVIRMDTLTPAEYQMMLDATEGELPDDSVPWLPPEQGWDALRARGDKDRGQTLIRTLGCGTCHQVPAVVGADATVGPPLTDWAKRHYIAGKLNNSPNNLVAWIVDPQQIEPETVMPNVGASEAEAWDIAAYLYSLGGESGGSRRLLERPLAPVDAGQPVAEEETR